jgi:hydrogenase small subunit
MLGKLPALDQYGRPKFAYDRLVHDHCPRRAHFDAGRFVKEFGDDGHRQGWCLYQLGCKGPVTHAPCSTRHYNEVVDAWPIGVGAPCVGCTAAGVGYTIALHETVPIKRPNGPDTYPAVYAEREGISPVATGVAGIVGGALVGAGYLASKKFDNVNGDNEPKE